MVGMRGIDKAKLKTCFKQHDLTTTGTQMSYEHCVDMKATSGCNCDRKIRSQITGGEFNLQSMQFAMIVPYSHHNNVWGKDSKS